jgi:P27 family predicted phage terminase small subunit
MQRGGKPVPHQLRILRGNPGHRPLPKGEVHPLRPETVPEPPKRLLRNEDARDEWNRIAPELWRLNLLTVADIQSLAMYCQAYGRWCEAEDALYEMAKDDPKYHAIVVEGQNGGLVSNPLFKATSVASLNLMRFCVEFGFTPSSRTRITGSASGDEPDRKFAGLIAQQQ